jgi:hypothetical protein
MVDPAAGDLVDLAFPVAGRTVPPPTAACWPRRSPGLPWLGATPGTGMHRLNLSAGAGRSAVGPHAADAACAAGALDGGGRGADRAELLLDGETLRLGVPVVRALLPHRTLYAHFVDAADDDELAFLARMEDELRALGVACRTVCGRLQSLPDRGWACSPATACCSTA